MVRLTDQTYQTQFVKALKAAGGRVPNGQLQEGLGWTEDKYWRIHQQLFDAGHIERGRGRGGIVLLVSASTTGVSAAEAAAELNRPVAELPAALQPSNPMAQGELALYAPIKAQLELHWASRSRLHDCHCEIVALQGRRETGGSWSRPDLCVVGVRTYEYFPGRTFELHTFEVKNSNDVTIKGVLEALAHREAATRSYVLYFTAGADFLSYPESSRIIELAGRHGIGMVAVHQLNDINTWEELVPAQLANSDPEAINTFISRSLSEDAKRKLRLWYNR